MEAGVISFTPAGIYDMFQYPQTHKFNLNVQG